MAGTYINPGWTNDSSPAINQTNLNNLSDAVVENQGDIGDLETLLANYSTVETNAGNVPTLASRVKIGKGISVPTTAWAADSTYSAQGYGYRATVAVSGVTATYVPFVTFGVADAISGNYAPAAVSTTDGVYIYAKSAPVAAITIPSVVCITA